MPVGAQCGGVEVGWAFELALKEVAGVEGSAIGPRSQGTGWRLSRAEFVVSKFQAGGALAIGVNPEVEGALEAAS